MRWLGTKADCEGDMIRSRACLRRLTIALAPNFIDYITEAYGAKLSDARGLFHFRHQDNKIIILIHWEIMMVYESKYTSN